MPPIKRSVAPPPAPAGVNFGDDAFYMGGGFNLPEGNYALLFDTRLHAYTKANGTQGDSNLGVFVTAFPLLEDPKTKELSYGDEPLTQFYGMGKKAKLSFAPDPDTGKSLIPIPNAPAQTAPRLTNWDIFRRSLLDSGLPGGIFTNDISVLDGVWVHIQNVKPPEERKAFGSNTGEAQQEERENLISVVSEILEGGEPWAGGGGLPDGAAAPAPSAPKPVARAAVRAAAPAARPVAAAARPTAVRKVATAPVVEEPAAEEGDAEAITAAASAALTAVLSKNPKGLKKLMLRTQVFKELADDADMAQLVMDQIMDSDEALGGVIGELGFTLSGKNGIDVVPA